MMKSIVEEKLVSFKTLEQKGMCQVIVGTFPFSFDV